MNKKTLATLWLDGCSGCHMSFLDTDERLLELLAKFELVYSPIIDVKEFPENVDIALVEGAISSREDLEKIKHIRERSRVLVAFGDCAVTGNVPSMRNQFTVGEVLDHAYIATAPGNDTIPVELVPALLAKARPLNAYVEVDFHLQGCPPSADLIYYVLCELADGRVPDVQDKARFG